MLRWPDRAAKHRYAGQVIYFKRLKENRRIDW